MCLNLDTRAQRRIGQTRNTGLESIHGNNMSQKMAPSRTRSDYRWPTDVAINAPPLSSSGSEVGSAIHEQGNASSELSEPESASSRKRKKRQDSMGPNKRRHTLAQEDGYHSTDDNPMKSNISCADFTNTDMRLSSRPMRFYGGKYNQNIHAEKHPKSREQSKKLISAPSSQTSSFKFPDKKALDACMFLQPLH